MDVRTCLRACVGACGRPDAPGEMAHQRLLGEPGDGGLRQDADAKRT